MLTGDGLDGSFQTWQTSALKEATFRKPTGKFSAPYPAEPEIKAVCRLIYKKLIRSERIAKIKGDVRNRNW